MTQDADKLVSVDSAVVSDPPLDETILLHLKCKHLSATSTHAAMLQFFGDAMIPTATPLGNMQDQ